MARDLVAAGDKGDGGSGGCDDNEIIANDSVDGGDINSDWVDVDLDRPTSSSDLSLPNRRIWIVTTASLPWMTGTAVNPLLRALYLARERPSGRVTLVIPWLERRRDRAKLYGEKNPFADGKVGKKEQEEWIRHWAVEKGKFRSDEVDKVGILWYDGKYRRALGSILPTVDICALIPAEEADVAILEEPEHLNWLRVPNKIAPSDRSSNDNGEMENGAAADDDDDGHPPRRKGLTRASSGVLLRAAADGTLGWKHKFNHVVGIVHTNYAAYAKEATYGAAIAPQALTALSALVIRAYCHRVIKLSAVIPIYAPGRELTCNVHGVRAEFLQRSSSSSVAVVIGDQSAGARSSSAASGTADAPPVSLAAAERGVDDNKTTGNECDSKKTDDRSPAAVYFIGKLLWAKGFDRMLKVQDKYRRKTGTYFPLDVYGGGPDEKAIGRAFLGRRYSLKNKALSFRSHLRQVPRIIKEDIRGKRRPGKEEAMRVRPDSAAASATGTGVEPKGDGTHTPSLSSIPAHEPEPSSQDEIHCTKHRGKREKVAGQAHGDRRRDDDDGDGKEGEEDKGFGDYDSISILSSLPTQSIIAGRATTHAVANLADHAVQSILAMATASSSATGGAGEKRKRFDPPHTRYEFRRNPIPARFLGVIDHAALRDMPEHKIFLNPSISEVLCTTTAEALAMGKFVIIPRHPSNEFFLQFPTCLSYGSLEECVERLCWALNHEPEPFDPDMAGKFTWEAATERLIDASYITKRERLEYERTRVAKADDRIAWFHSQTGSKGDLVRKMFQRKRRVEKRKRATSDSDSEMDESSEEEEEEEEEEEDDDALMVHFSL